MATEVLPRLHAGDLIWWYADQLFPGDTAAGAFNCGYALVVTINDKTLSGYENASEVEVKPQIGCKTGTQRWVRYPEGLTAMRKITVPGKMFSIGSETMFSSAICGDSLHNIEDWITLLNEKKCPITRAPKGFQLVPGRSWRPAALGADEYVQGLRESFAANPEIGGMVAAARRASFDREADEQIWLNASVLVVKSGARCILDLVSHAVHVENPEAVLENVLSYLYLLSCRTAFFTPAVKQQLITATSALSPLVRLASLRSATTLWRGEFEGKFTLVQYDTVMYKRVHQRLKPDQLRQAEATWKGWETIVEHKPDLAALAESDSRLGAFGAGVIQYKDRVYHRASRFGEWALLLLSLYPWARCTNPSGVVHRPENYTLGGTDLNRAHGTCLAILAEMPRHEPRPVEYMMTCALATLLSKVAQVPGFDHSLIRSGNAIFTPSHLKYFCAGGRVESVDPAYVERKGAAEEEEEKAEAVGQPQDKGQAQEDMMELDEGPGEPNADDLEIQTLHQEKALRYKCGGKVMRKIWKLLGRYTDSVPRPNEGNEGEVFGSVTNRGLSKAVLPCFAGEKNLADFGSGAGWFGMFAAARHIVVGFERLEALHGYSERMHTFCLANGAKLNALKFGKLSTSSTARRHALYISVRLVRVCVTELASGPMARRYKGSLALLCFALTACMNSSTSRSAVQAGYSFCAGCPSLLGAVRR